MSDLMRNIIKYVGLALVIIGIVLVVRNLFTSESDWETSANSSNDDESGYSATISLLDKDTNSYLSDAKLAIEDSEGNVVYEWTTGTGVYLATNLENGSYTLVETEAPDGYNIDEEGVSFTIEGKDTEVTMYNTAMTEEEIIAQNTSASEVGVDNTLSVKGYFMSVVAVISIGLGISLIYFTRKNKLFI